MFSKEYLVSVKKFELKQIGNFVKRVAIAQKYMPPAMSTTARTDSERKQILSKYVVTKVSQGWRVELQADFEAVLLIGTRPNHILHLLLSVVTFGLWLIVWALISMNGGPKSLTASVDQFGNIHLS
jgi:formyltetrahydrofolate hydrolase